MAKAKGDIPAKIIFLDVGGQRDLSVIIILSLRVNLSCLHLE